MRWTGRDGTGSWNWLTSWSPLGGANKQTNMIICIFRLRHQVRIHLISVSCHQVSRTILIPLNSFWCPFQDDLPFSCKWEGADGRTQGIQFQLKDQTFSVHRLLTYLIFVTDTRTVSMEKKSVMWRNFKFLYKTYEEKSKISPHVDKFHISPHDRCGEIWNLLLYVYNLWYFVAFYAVLLQKV